MAKARVIGDRELIAALRRMPQVTSGRSLDEAMGASLEPLRSATERNARVLRQPGPRPKGGHLDEGVATRKVVARGQYYRQFWVAFTNRARRIAHLVEFGTAPHFQPRRGIMHPGARPKPFFRPAFQVHKGDVVAEFGRRVWAGMQRFTLSAVKGRRR